eukprot:6202189-Pleurochrysis_carterae.AAC.1
MHAQPAIERSKVLCILEGGGEGGVRAFDGKDEKYKRRPKHANEGNCERDGYSKHKTKKKKEGEQRGVCTVPEF